MKIKKSWHINTYHSEMRKACSKMCEENIIHGCKIDGTVKVFRRRLVCFSLEKLIKKVSIRITVRNKIFR